MALKLNINVESLTKITKLPLSRRLLILAVINVVIILLMGWFLLAPKYWEIRKLGAQLKELNVKLNESRVIAADIPKYLKEKEEMEEKLKLAVAQLPNEKEIPDLIDGISDAGQKAGLKILLFQPGKEVKKGFYAEVPVNMSVEGRYESLVDFSVKIGALPRIVNIGGLDVSSTGHKNRIPVLKANFVATTFRFIPASDAAPQPKAEGAQPKK